MTSFYNRARALNMTENLENIMNLNNNSAIKGESFPDAPKIHIIEESCAAPQPHLLSKNDIVRMPENRKTTCNLITTNTIFRANLNFKPHINKILTRSHAYHAYITISRINDGEIVKVVHEKSRESATIRDFDGGLVAVGLNRRDFLAVLDNTVSLYIYSIKFTDNVLYDIIYKHKFDFNPINLVNPPNSVCYPSLVNPIHSNNTIVPFVNSNPSKSVNPYNPVNPINHFEISATNNNPANLTNPINPLNPTNSINYFKSTTTNSVTNPTVNPGIRPNNLISSFNHYENSIGGNPQNNPINHFEISSNPINDDILDNIDNSLNLVWCDSLTIFSLVVYRHDRVLINDFIFDPENSQMITSTISGFEECACACISRDASKVVAWYAEKRLRIFERDPSAATAFSHTKTIDVSAYSKIKHLFFYDSIDLRPLSFVAVFEDRIKIYDFDSLAPISNIFFDYPCDFFVCSFSCTYIFAFIDHKNQNLVVLKLLEEDLQHHPHAIYFYPLNTKSIAFCVDDSKFNETGMIDVYNMTLTGMQFHSVVIDENISQNNSKIPHHNFSQSYDQICPPNSAQNSVQISQQISQQSSIQNSVQNSVQNSAKKQNKYSSSIQIKNSPIEAPKIPTLIPTHVLPLPKKFNKNKKFDNKMQNKTPDSTNKVTVADAHESSSMTFLKPMVDSDSSTTDYEDNQEKVSDIPSKESIPKEMNESIMGLRRYIDQSFAASNRNLETVIHRSMTQSPNQGGKFPNNFNKRFDTIETRLKCLEENIILLVKKGSEAPRSNTDCLVTKKDIQSVYSSIAELSAKFDKLKTNTPQPNPNSALKQEIQQMINTFGAEIKNEIENKINQRLIPVYRQELNKMFESINFTFQEGTHKYLASVGGYIDQIQEEVVRLSKDSNNSNLQQLLTVFKQDMLLQIKKLIDSNTKTLAESLMQRVAESTSNTQPNEKDNEKLKKLKEFIKKRDFYSALKISVENSNSISCLHMLLNSVQPNILFSNDQNNMSGVAKLFEICIKHFPLSGIDFSLLCDHLSEAAFLLRINSNLIEPSFKKILDQLALKINEYVTSKNIQSSSHKALCRIFDALIRDI